MGDARPPCPRAARQTADHRAHATDKAKKHGDFLSSIIKAGEAEHVFGERSYTEARHASPLWDARERCPSHASTHTHVGARMLHGAHTSARAHAQACTQAHTQIGAYFFMLQDMSVVEGFHLVLTSTENY